MPHREAITYNSPSNCVCGISRLCLGVELRGSTAIDELDRNDRSPLWYAVKQQKVDYVRVLLKYGADPSIGDPPLWAAKARWGDFTITELLLDHGASLNPALSPGGAIRWLPWAFADPDHNEVRFDQLLIRHGININHGALYNDVENATVLMRLASQIYISSTSRHQRRLRNLIKLGADVEAIDKEGRTAIMYAISSASTKAFSVLASSGARLDMKTVTGSTILHLIIAHTVWYAKTPSVYPLCKSTCKEDLTRLDLDSQDEDGNTAYDLIVVRNRRWDAERKVRGNDKQWQGLFHEYDLKQELLAISALEKLLHHVQESQGVPEAERYPPLGEYCSRDAEDRVVPEAWPAY